VTEITTLGYSGTVECMRSIQAPFYFYNYFILFSDYANDICAGAPALNVISVPSVKKYIFIYAAPFSRN